MESLNEIRDRRQKADKERLRQFSLGRLLKPSGQRNCKCGRTISANKTECFGCQQSKAA